LRNPVIRRDHHGTIQLTCQPEKRAISERNGGFIGKCPLRTSRRLITFCDGGSGVSAPKAGSMSACGRDSSTGGLALASTL
jgi:hypothetical protein